MVKEDQENQLVNESQAPLKEKKRVPKLKYEEDLSWDGDDTKMKRKESEIASST